MLTLKLACIGILVGGLLQPLIAQEESVTPSNILLVIIDDFSAEESTLYNTQPRLSASLPNMPTVESLASSGTVFNHAWAYPSCTPTRAAIITGRYGFRTNVGSVGMELGQNETTLPEIFALQAPEYALAQFGKWHLGGGNTGPNTIGGWPHFEGTLTGGISDYFSWNKVTNGETEAMTTYSTTEIVDNFLSWHENQQDSPWFAWLAFHAPHTPFHAPPEDLHTKGNLNDPLALFTNRTYYEAACEAFDTEFGRLLEGIDRNNTAILFIGDNGTPNQVRQEYMERGTVKGSLQQGGVRIPMVIDMPGDDIQLSRVNEPVHVLDLFSTILDVAGINYEPNAEQPLDAVSLMPWLMNDPESLPDSDFNYTEYFDPDDPTLGGKTIRNERYKLIVPSTGEETLYDLLHDPYEQTNLLDSTETSETVQAVYTSLNAALQALNP